MPKPIYLTMKEVLLNAKKALKSRRLQAVQGLERPCVYHKVVDGKHIRCVIGASLTNAQAAMFDFGAWKYITYCIRDGDIIFPSEEEADLAIELQSEHDSLCRLDLPKEEKVKRMEEILKDFEALL